LHKDLSLLRIIKELGTNGGGFFGANSAHPFENPTPLSNFIEMFAIFAIASSLTYTLGRMTGRRGTGWAVWQRWRAVSDGCDDRLLVGGSWEPDFEKCDQRASAMQSAETWKARSPLRNREFCFVATVTSDTSCGAVNSQHDSFTPLGGMCR